MSLRCFDSVSFDPSKLDIGSFKCRHTLQAHPALGLDNLARVLPALPKNQVMYSTKRLQTHANFEKTFVDRPDVPIEAVLEGLRESDSYIMISSPEVDASFKGLYRDLISDVSELMGLRKLGTTPLQPTLFLFLASPKSVTPFHIDRYSTLLLQFRGSKRVAVFPQWDQRVVPDQPLEDYVARRSTSLRWSPEMNALGTTYEFAPGEALHIPFAAGHHVENGADDVSISMSIIFNTRESVRWRDALLFNSVARKYLTRAGLPVTGVGHDPVRDTAKAVLWRSANKTRRLSHLFGKT